MPAFSMVFDMVLAAALLIIAALVLNFVVVWAVEGTIELRNRYRQRRMDRYEVEADAQSERLRETIYGLSARISEDRDEASREMTRVAFLTTGRVPPSA
jgi:hypothetical protein